MPILNLPAGHIIQVFTMTVLKGAIPWWGLPLNWIIGGSGCKYCLFMVSSITATIVAFGNLSGSLFFAAILVKCELLS